MKRILVPTDFSPIADYGLQVAIEIARKTGAEIFLLNVIAPIHDSKFSAMGAGAGGEASEESRYIVELHRVYEDKLYDIIGRHYTNEVDIHAAIAIDDMQEGIRQFIDEHKIGLVVMGTSGESTYTEYFIGNHTEQVIRIANCPVLSIKKQVPDFKVENIVLAADLNNVVFEGVEHVKKLASYYGASIHILHVLPSRTSSEKKARKQLEDFVKDHHFENANINIVQNSNQQKAVLQFARQKQADLIAVFTHGRTGLSNLVFGSMAEELVKAAEIPVLTSHINRELFDLE